MGALKVVGRLISEDSHFIDKKGGFYVHSLFVKPSEGGRPLEVKASSDNGHPLFAEGEEVQISVYVDAWSQEGSNRASYSLKKERDKKKAN